MVAGEPDLARSPRRRSTRRRCRSPACRRGSCRPSGSRRSRRSPCRRRCRCARPRCPPTTWPNCLVRGVATSTPGRRAWSRRRRRRSGSCRAGAACGVVMSTPPKSPSRVVDGGRREVGGLVVVAGRDEDPVTGLAPRSPPPGSRRTRPSSPWNVPTSSTWPVALRVMVADAELIAVAPTAPPTSTTAAAAPSGTAESGRTLHVQPPHGWTRIATANGGDVTATPAAPRVAHGAHPSRNNVSPR